MRCGNDGHSWRPTRRSVLPGEWHAMNWTLVPHHPEEPTGPSGPTAPTAGSGPTAPMSQPQPVPQPVVAIGDPPGNVAGAPANNGVPWSNMDQFDALYLKWGSHFGIDPAIPKAMT